MEPIVLQELKESTKNTERLKIVCDDYTNSTIEYY